jgi:hypothetical protein
VFDAQRAQRPQVINKRLVRPRQGMPPEFYKDSPLRPNRARKFKSAIVRAWKRVPYKVRMTQAYHEGQSR